MSIRRAYHRHFGYHGRFHLAVLFTIFVVSYVAVPTVARFVDSMSGYNPTHYEPKDFERESWLSQHTHGTLLDGVQWDDLVGAALFVMVAVVWLTFVPMRAPRRRDPPR